MKKSESIAKLAESLSKAQAGLSAVTRNKTVTVRPRSGGAPYSFEYTTFDRVIEHVRKALTENGLWFVQTLLPKKEADASSEFYQGGVMVLETTLLHSSGEWISSEIFIPDQGNDQALGSTLTYRKRYALSSILGLGSESDDDANAGDGNVVIHAAAVERTTQATAEPPPSNKARDAAKGFLDDANVYLQQVTDLTDFQAWHKDNLSKIARLRSYFPQEHKDLIALIESTQITLEG